jgi:type II secretory pathway pseudopilin PulG
MNNEDDVMLIRNSKGFSLVETLVAAAVIALSVVAVVSMVRKGQEQMKLDQHRRTARGYLQRMLEDPKFYPENYNGLVTGITTTSIIIDSAAGLNGTLKEQIRGEGNITTGQVPGPPNVPRRRITDTLFWSERAAGNNTYNDTITVEKWVSSVQRK